MGKMPIATQGPACLNKLGWSLWLFFVKSDEKDMPFNENI